MFYLEFQFNDGAGFYGDQSDNELAVGIRWDFGYGQHRLLEFYDPLIEKIKKL